MALCSLQHDDKGSTVHSHISHSIFSKELREDQSICFFVGPIYTIDATHKDTLCTYYGISMSDSEDMTCKISRVHYTYNALACKSWGV